jgi:hypothetical protein
MRFPPGEILFYHQFVRNYRRRAIYGALFALLPGQARMSLHPEKALLFLHPDAAHLHHVGGAARRLRSGNNYDRVSFFEKLFFQ